LRIAPDTTRSDPASRSAIMNTSSRGRANHAFGGGTRRVIRQFAHYSDFAANLRREGGASNIAEWE
jgi:hypothetical protein